MSLPIAPLLLALSLQGAADDPADGMGVRLDAAAWGVIPGGTLTITRGSRPGSGTPLRIDDDFDLHPVAAPALAGRWEFLDSHAIGVQAAIVDLSGTGTVQESFIYHGTTFDPGRRIRVEQDFSLVEFEYQFTFLRGDPIRAAAHLGGEYWAYSGRIRTEDALAPVDTSRAFDSGYWLAGVELSWTPHPRIELRGLAVGGIERSRQNFFKLEADGLFHPATGFAVFLGYRYQALRFRQSTNASDLRFQGPLLGVEVAF